MNYFLPLLLHLLIFGVRELPLVFGIGFCLGKWSFVSCRYKNNISHLAELRNNAILGKLLTFTFNFRYKKYWNKQYLLKTETITSQDLLVDANVESFFPFTVCRRPVRVHWVTSTTLEDSGSRPKTGAGPETPLCPHLLHPLLRAAGNTHAGQRWGWGHRYARLPHHDFPKEGRGGGVRLCPGYCP